MTNSPKISTVICTRNRGSRIEATLKSLLACTHPSFEIVIIDQSTNQETQETVAAFCNDARIRYIPTKTIGTGISRKLGAEAARGEIIAYTDDDCTVPPDWLDVIDSVFEQQPRVGAVFCNVLPALHNLAKGFVPEYIRETDLLVKTLWQKCTARGIGAGMAFRRDVLLSIGNFDPKLGPGTRFPGCEDGDVAVRVLLNKWHIYETAKTHVIHDGFRTWEEGVELTKRNWVGIGAAYAKPLKAGHWGSLVIVGYEAFVLGLFIPLSLIFKRKKPRGIKRFIYFCEGFFQALTLPVDREKILFR